MKHLLVRATLPGLFAAGIALLGVPPARADVAGDIPDAARFRALDVFELERAADPQISPDGRSIAYVRQSMDVMKDQLRSNIWTLDTASGEHRPLLSGRADFAAPRWSPDSRRLAYLSSVDGSLQLYVRWMDTGATALVTNLAETPGSLAWSPDGRQIAFTMAVKEESKPLAEPPPKPEGAEWAKPVKVVDKVIYRVDGAGFLQTSFTHVFTVPAEGGSPRQLTSGAFNHNGPLSWTPDSARIVFVANRDADWEYEPSRDSLWSVAIHDGALERLTPAAPRSCANPVVSPDGRSLAYIETPDTGRNHEPSVLRVMALDGTGDRALTAGLDRDVGGPCWSADSRHLTFQYEDRGNTRIATVDLAGALSVLTQEAGGDGDFGRPYTGGSFSVAADGTLAFTHTRPDRPADVALLTPGKPVRVLTGLNEDLLGHRQLGAVREITWTSSADGREIQGWIVTPPGFDRTRKYPLILEIHGGPMASYGPHFAAEIQRYAAEGYAVLYCNPRGSTGYGDAFIKLIDRAYPGQDYDDLMSGVDAVLAEGWADPENLFVTGGSGGGLLTAWIVGKTDRFRAAAVAKPVINQISFALTADYSTYFARYWFGKMPWEDVAGYWKLSPLSLVGNVTTPTLLMTGEADFRTPISETEQFFTALKLRRIDTVMIRVPDSPHDISSRPSHLVAKVDNILAWFARHRADAGRAPVDER